MTLASRDRNSEPLSGAIAKPNLSSQYIASPNELNSEIVDRPPLELHTAKLLPSNCLEKRNATARSLETVALAESALKTGRDGLMNMNPNSFRKMVTTLLEANGRGYWETNEENLDKLRQLYQEVEDRIEGID